MWRGDALGQAQPRPDRIRRVGRGYVRTSARLLAAASEQVPGRRIRILFGKQQDAISGFQNSASLGHQDLSRPVEEHDEHAGWKRETDDAAARCRRPFRDGDLAETM